MEKELVREWKKGLQKKGGGVEEMEIISGRLWLCGDISAGVAGGTGCA